MRQKLKRVSDNLFRECSTGVYYCIVKKNGRQIRRSLKTDDRALAKRKLSVTLAQAGRISGQDCPLMELAPRWMASLGHQKEKTILRKEAALVEILRAFPISVRSVSPVRLEDWKRHREAQVSARTFNIEREVFSQLMTYAVTMGIIGANPVKELPRRKQTVTKVEAPAKEAFALAIAEMRRSPRAECAANLCELMAYSGMRLGEATAVLWRDVDWQRRTLTVTGGEYGTKNGQERVLPMSQPLYALLERIRASWPYPPQPEERITPTRSADVAIRRACRDVGVPAFTHHALRHFFATNAIEAGVDFKTVADWLGHKDGGILAAKTYGHLRNEHSEQMATRLTFSVVAAASAASSALADSAKDPAQS